MQKIPENHQNFQRSLWYSSLIAHNHLNLPSTVKFLYLEGCLTGDAAKIEKMY